MQMFVRYNLAWEFIIMEYYCRSLFIIREQLQTMCFNTVTSNLVVTQSSPVRVACFF
jgi:hypothetical protein